MTDVSRLGAISFEKRSFVVIESFGFAVIQNDDK